MAESCQGHAWSINTAGAPTGGQFIMLILHAKRNLGSPTHPARTLKQGRHVLHYLAPLASLEVNALISTVLTALWLQ